MADNEKIISSNLMEELVDLRMDKEMLEAEMCMCDQCRADVRALALNKLPPRYVVTTAGGVMMQALNMSLQAQADIMAAMTYAIRVVKTNPRHKD